MFENWFDTKDYNDYNTAVAILQWWGALTPAEQTDAVYFADRARLAIYITAVDIAVLMGDLNFDLDTAHKLSQYYVAAEEADNA